MKQVTKFESTDGKLFDTKQECEEYEFKANFSNYLFETYGRSIPIDDAIKLILGRTSGLTAEFIKELGQGFVEPEKVHHKELPNYRTLKDKLRKLHGLDPYNTPNNLVREDSYFAASIKRDFKEEDISRACKELGI